MLKIDRLKEIVSYYCDDVIDETYSLKNLNLNELDTFDFLMDIEDEFEISIDEDEFNNLETIQDLFDYIKENID